MNYCSIIGNFDFTSVFNIVQIYFAISLQIFPIYEPLPFVLTGISILPLFQTLFKYILPCPCRCFQFKNHCSMYYRKFPFFHCFQHCSNIFFPFIAVIQCMKYCSTIECFAFCQYCQEVFHSFIASISKVKSNISIIA